MISSFTDDLPAWIVVTGMAVMETNFIFKIARRLRGYTEAFLLTIRFTKNWPAAFLAYLLKRPIQIIFRNGLEGSYDWRDIEIILGILADKKSLKRLPNGIFEVNFDGMSIRAPIWNMDCLGYIFSRNLYDAGIDYRGKAILDIGAYIGDTALYFWHSGAAKVICYEPVVAFFFWLKQNIELNGINAEAYNYGISERGGEVDVLFSNCDCDFGFVGGNHNLKIKTIALNEVVQKHQSIDIVKLTCGKITEGVLNNLKDTELAMVPTWIIVTTLGIVDENMAMSLKDKFNTAGFRINKLTSPLVFEQVRDKSLIL